MIPQTRTSGPVASAKREIANQAYPMDNLNDTFQRAMTGLEEPSDFHGARHASREIQKERAQHRLAAYLFTTGLSQKAIAERLDVSPGTISTWWRQSWMQDLVKHEMALAGRDTLQDIIKGAATDSVFTLITLRDDHETPASVRRQCCSEILDRALGKAPQTVHNVNYEGEMKDMDRINDELRQLLGDKALMQSLQPSLS